MTALAERLLLHAVSGEGGCWLWPGTKSPDGYGRITIDRKTVQVHRRAYECFVGPIPAGLQVDHVCFNRACFNPAHLRLLSLLDNASNQRSKLATHCQRGHEFSPENTWTYPRKNKAGTWRRTCKVCQRAQIALRRSADGGAA